MPSGKAQNKDREKFQNEIRKTSSLFKPNISTVIILGFLTMVENRKLIWHMWFVLHESKNTLGIWQTFSSCYHPETALAKDNKAKVNSAKEPTNTGHT